VPRHPAHLATQGTYQIRSGKTFAGWTGDHAIVPNPTFNLEDLLREAISCENSSGNCTESEDDGIDDGVKDRKTDLEEPQIPPVRHPPTPRTTATSSQIGPSMPDVSPSAKDRRRARLKSQSHINRKHQRQTVRNESFSHHKPRSSTYNKYVATATPIVTPMSTATARVAKSAFVGLDDRIRSQTAHKLEDVVGEGSRYNFTLQTWDGRFIHPSLHL